MDPRPPCGEATRRARTVHHNWGRGHRLRYRGSFYAIDEVEYLCAWCVADGTAASTFDGEFNDWAGIDGVPAGPDAAPSVDVDEARVVSERTPSYTSWQQEQWRSHRLHADAS